MSSLVDLIHAPGSDASPSPKPLSLPAAMRALERGEIEYPTADAIEGLLTVQPRPVVTSPAAGRKPIDDFLDKCRMEAHEQARFDRAAMAHVSANKARACAAFGDHEKAQRLSEAYAQLNGEYHVE